MRTDVFRFRSSVSQQEEQIPDASLITQEANQAGYIIRGDRGSGSDDVCSDQRKDWEAE